jgi:hypothetical protein
MSEREGGKEKEGVGGLKGWCGCKKGWCGCKKGWGGGGRVISIEKDCTRSACIGGTM